MAKKATASRIVNLKARVDLDTGTVHASKSALRFAGLQPASKDKGRKVEGFTNKKGERVPEYLEYSVLDAVPLAKEVKTSKKADKDYDLIKALLENPDAKALLLQLAKAKK